MSPPTPTHRRTYAAEFAAYYDRITVHKAYAAEIATLARLIDERGGGPGARVLDVGCGTGTHASFLAERGFDVTAIEPEPDMARQAESKAVTATVVCTDVAGLADGGFSTCVSLFNVVNCLPSLAALVAFFGEISDRLVEGGLLVVETWNPIAVIALPPTVVTRTYETDTELISRTVVPTCDFLHQRLDLEYRVEVEPRDQQQGEAQSFSSTHELLLFTPLEVEFALGQAGFGDVEVRTALPDLDPARPSDRMLAFVAGKARTPESL